MVTLEHFFRWLSVNKLLDAFISELIAQHKTDAYFRWAYQNDNCCKAYISSAFSWDDTIQGWKFWYNVFINWSEYLENLQS